MSIKTQAPVTVLFRGDLRDTAILIGLVQANIPIGTIAYTGPLENKNFDHIKAVNKWLQQRGCHAIEIHPHLSCSQLERIPIDPLSQWGWSLNECQAIVKLSGLDQHL